MRTRLYVALAVALSLAPVANAAEITRETFKVRSVADIVDLCSAPRESDMGKYAYGFCFGWLRGIDEFYDAMLADKRFKMKAIACPESQLTYEEQRDLFVGWARKTKGAMEMPALNGLVRAAKETFPCS